MQLDGEFSQCPVAVEFPADVDYMSIYLSF